MKLVVIKIDENPQAYFVHFDNLTIQCHLRSVKLKRIKTNRTNLYNCYQAFRCIPVRRIFFNFYQYTHPLARFPESRKDNARTRKLNGSKHKRR